MGKHLYKKPEPADIQGPCVICGTGLQLKDYRKGREGKFMAYCRPCKRRLYQKHSRRGKVDAYRKHKKDHCERCGFVAEDPVQLDVDHKDGDRSNDDPNNLQTLCANCHRLKTKRSKDGGYGFAKKEWVNPFQQDE